MVTPSSIKDQLFLKIYAHKHNTKDGIVTIIVVTTVLFILLNSYSIFHTNGTVEYYIRSESALDGGSYITSGLQPYNGSDGTEDRKSLPVCDMYPSSLWTSNCINIQALPVSMGTIVEANPYVEPGGSFHPTNCSPNQHVAIIIPYRDRWSHLLELLSVLHPLLQRQQRHYSIFVVEQTGDGIFNKGRLMNTAYQEVQKSGAWDCIIFHDVDMLPERDDNLYLCGVQPVHMSPAVDEMRYTLMYSLLVGGVLAVQPKHFEAANGYSNTFWGWGGEDDDMALRLTSAGLQITRPPFSVGKYKMIHHAKRKPSDNRYVILKESSRRQEDGLSSVSSSDVTVLSVTSQPLYTNISVDVGSPTMTEPGYSFTDFIWKKALSIWTPLSLGL